MTVLELRFPAGRFHATPWGRHVNEGAVEWPPSPWRLLRGLIATWHGKAKTELPESTVRALVASLASPPRYRLPRATTSHTRHYMPVIEGKKEKTTKIFDTFVQLAEGSSVLVAWDVNLPDPEAHALNLLAARLGYLGRAEGLVEARLLEGVSGIEANAFPLVDGRGLPPSMELTRLLTPMSSGQFEEWSTTFTARALADLGPKPTAAQKRKLPRVPSDLFDALHADTGELQAAGWNLPPGAEVVNYARREDSLTPAVRPRAARRGPPPTVARYAVVGAVPPRIVDAVSLGARVHRWLCKLADGKPAPVFTGKDESDGPRTGHQHAHIFCEANGPRDAVTHLTLWAPMGFDEEACLVLRKLNKVWGQGEHDVRLVLHAIGSASEFGDCPLMGTAKVWRSLTPFVSTLHAKTYRDGRPKLDANGWQQGSAGHDLLRHLAQHPHGAGATIRQLDERDRPFQFGSQSLRSLEFQTRRHDGEGRRGPGSGSAFEISFTEPVTGPLAFGYGSHFGLGLFVPA